MDNEIYDAIDAHRAKFGEFDATIINLNMGDPEIRQQLLSAIQTAIDTGVPISDKALGLNDDLPEDADL